MRLALLLAALLVLVGCDPSDTQPGYVPPAPVTAPGPTPPPLED